jgi:hypothetical protein
MVRRAGGPNPGENIAAESSEPDKEGGGGPSATEKSGRSSVLIGSLITGGETVVGAVIVAVVAIVINHGSNSTVPASPPHPEASGDMPVPNCPTCISGAGQDLHRAGGRGQYEEYLPEPARFWGLGQPVQPGEKVEVVCWFYQSNAEASVKRDGWWYLIASQPWNRQYYTVANSYLNGDPPEGPYINTVDNGVPVCTAKS